MTEADWLKSQIPRWMLKHLGDADDRKLRLLATACCRRLGGLLSPAGRAALDVNERFADGAASLAELTRARQSAKAAYYTADRRARQDAGRRSRSHAAWAVWAALRQVPDSKDPDVDDRPTVWAAAAVRMAGVALNPAFVPSRPAGLEGGTKAERATQAALMRDVFGNPFRTVAFSPSWRTTAAVGLAASMYESRDFSAMPVLADALEEAGCNDAQVLTHCRGPGPHVRGCWVVDGVLGKP